MSFVAPLGGPLAFDPLNRYSVDDDDDEDDADADDSGGVYTSEQQSRAA